MYILYFDIAALMVFPVVLSLYFRQKSLPVLQNRAYFLFIVCAFATTLFEVISMIFYRYPQSVPPYLYWIVEGLMYATSLVLPQVYVVYILGQLNYFEKKDYKKSLKLSIAVIIPFAIFILLLLLSPVTYYLADYPLIYYIDSETNLYHRGGVFRNSIYFIMMYYILLAVGLVFKYRRNFRSGSIPILVFYIFVILVAEVIQLFFPKLLVQNFALSLMTIMYSSLISTPEKFIDSTTDLYNTNAFNRNVSIYYSHHEKFLVISLILDDIPFVSNTFGISVMNVVLREIAQYLKKQFKNADIYYIPQEKFCLIFKNYDFRLLERVKTELKLRFRKDWFADGKELKLYARMCFIECPEDAVSVEDIHDILDLVSTESRYKGEEIYARDIDVKLRKKNSNIIHLLKTGLMNASGGEGFGGSFSVYYQPIFSVHEERLIGAEALLRLKDEDGVFVSPEEFIPIAERTGDILDIGTFVIKEVCKTLSSIDINEYRIKKIDINLSVVQCMQENMVEQINALFDSCKEHFSKSIINMEITETAAAHTPDILYKNMEDLEKAGIELSLDDYGSGYSNMGYLLSMPFKMIKIDKYIVWSAFEDTKANIALAATIKMIKQLGMKVLAEGVETEEQVKWLSSLGCDYLQGFYFAKGLPPEEYLALMKSDAERHSKAVDKENKYLREFRDDFDDMDNFNWS